MRPANGVVVLAIASIGALASCYRPTSERACEVGCTFADNGTCPSGLSCFDSASGGVCRTTSDTCTDVIHDAPGGDGTFCFGSEEGLIRGCVPEQPTGPVTDLSLIDTSVGTSDCVTMKQNNDERDDVCAIFASEIDMVINPQVLVRGSRPLVLIASGTITLGDNKTLTAASHQIGGPGAAANSPHCETPNTAPIDAGGAGGSFQGLGGGGGRSGGSVGTPPRSVSSDELLRGGCPGGSGADSPLTNGNGGGAVYLIAGNTITIAGTINASGSAAGLPSPNGNGSGGGSGGMIGLDAPAIIVGANAMIMANGGGGAAGSPGGAGTEPIRPDLAAAGGTSATAPGGIGSAATQLDGGGVGPVVTGTVGGGGGGAGYVAVFPTSQRQRLTVNQVSPPPTN